MSDDVTRNFMLLVELFPDCPLDLIDKFVFLHPNLPPDQIIDQFILKNVSVNANSNSVNSDDDELPSPTNVQRRLHLVVKISDVNVNVGGRGDAFAKCSDLVCW